MIVIALRHADKLQPPADGLSPKGIERAKLLARMLAKSGVSVAFRSEFLRTAETLKPLEDKLGAALAVRQVAVSGPGDADDHVQQVVAALTALPPETVAIVVTHSDTVGPIIAGLGGNDIEPIADDEFDKLFVVSIAQPGSVSLLELRYGAPTGSG